MAKRIGLARTQALIEGLKRELKLDGSTLRGELQQIIILSGSGATETLTSTDSGAIVALGAGSLTLLSPNCERDR